MQMKFCWDTYSKNLRQLNLKILQVKKKKKKTSQDFSSSY